MIPYGRGRRLDKTQSAILVIIVVFGVFVAFLLLSALVTHGAGPDGIPTDDPVYATIAAEQTLAAMSTSTGTFTPTPTATPTATAMVRVTPTLDLGHVCRVRIAEQNQDNLMAWQIAAARSRMPYTVGPGYIELWPAVGKAGCQ